MTCLFRATEQAEHTYTTLSRLSYNQEDKSKKIRAYTALTKNNKIMATNTKSR